MQPNNNPYWVKLSNFLLGIALAILLLNLTGGMAQKPPNGDKGQMGKSCNKSLTDIMMPRKQPCSGESELHHCYPNELSYDKLEGYSRPSRRFSVNSTHLEATGSCPTIINARELRVEFNNKTGAFLEEYHQLFLDLAANVGWKECKTTLVTVEPETKAPTGTTETRATSTKTTTVTSMTKSTTEMKSTTKSPVPHAIPVKEISNSYELTNALRTNCTIDFSGATLPKEGEFVIKLLHYTPEQLPGIGETMFTIKVTKENLTMETRFDKKPVIVARKDGIKESKTINDPKLKIKAFDNDYMVFFGDNALPNVSNHDHPLWAINYIHISGALQLNKPTIECFSTKPAQNGPLVDESKKLDNMMPTDLELSNLQFKDQKAALAVYLLKGCRKFNMNLCLYAMEYRLAYVGEEEGSKFVITMYKRQSKDGKDPTKREIGKVSKVNIYNGTSNAVTIGLSIDRGIGLRVHGDAWQSVWPNGTMAEMEPWMNYTHDDADFVQIKSEGEIDVGEWHFDMGLRPVQPLNKGKIFEPKKTIPPWIIQHKLTNWNNGDYIELRFKIIDTLVPIIMELYRGYPGAEFSQKILQVEINSKEEKIEFNGEHCNWNELRKKQCNSEEGTAILQGKEQTLEVNKEYLIQIMAHKNKGNHKYANGLKLNVLDANKISLANYTLVGGPPPYAIEYFRLLSGSISLVDEPKFCKKDGDN